MARDEDDETRSARLEEESAERSSLPSWLLDENGEVHVPETLEDGSTAVHWAAIANRPDVARVVLAAGAAVDARDKDNRTPLVLAARLNNAAVVEALLQGGASVRARDNERFTALGYAVGETRGEPMTITKLLLDAAGHSARELIAKEGVLLLAINAHKRNVKLLQLLISHGADIHARAGPHKRQALHFAARWGCDALIGTLLAAGADLHAVDDDGNTALQIAVANDHSKAMTELLAFGADMFAHHGKSIPAHDLAPRGGKARAALFRASRELWEADPAAFDRKMEEWYGQQGPFKSMRYCLQNRASCTVLEMAGSVLLPPLLLAAAVTSVLLVLWLLRRGRARRRRGRRQRSAGATVLAWAAGAWEWLMALPAMVEAFLNFINDTLRELFRARPAPAPAPEQQPRPRAAQTSGGARRRRNAGAGGRTRAAQQPSQPADPPAPITEARIEAEPPTLEDASAELAAKPSTAEPAAIEPIAEPFAKPASAEPSSAARELESAASSEPNAEAAAVVQTAKAPEPAAMPEAFPFLFPAPVPDVPASAPPPMPDPAPPATPVAASSPPPQPQQPEPPSPPSSPPPPQQHEPEAEQESGPLCSVCMDAPLQGIFIPCGHMAACVPCGSVIMRSSAVCPICSTPCTSFQRFFVAGAS